MTLSITRNNFVKKAYKNPITLSYSKLENETSKIDQLLRKLLIR